MNIQYVKSNIKKLSQQQLISLLSDMILDVVDNVEQFDSNIIYKKGAKVYLEESGRHYIYQCIRDNTSAGFIPANWIHLMEMFNSDVTPFCILRIQEETVKPTTSNIKEHTISLQYKVANSTVGIYKGLYRLVRNVDFTLSNKHIVLTEPLMIGERMIIEVRELLYATTTGLVIYDIEGNPFAVSINSSGVLLIDPIDITDPSDLKHATLVNGDKRYTLMVDSSTNDLGLILYEEDNPYISATNGKKYKINVIGKNYTVSEAICDCESCSVIMGTDKKTYNFSVSGNKLTPIVNNSYNTEDFTIGLKLRNENWDPVLLDVNAGTVRIIDYKPNVPYCNILMQSDDGIIYGVTVNSNMDVEIDDNVDYESSSSPVLNEHYFYDKNWKLWKIYMEGYNVVVENPSEIEYRDSRGINMISKSGIDIKFIMDTEEPRLIEYIDFAKSGTFRAPLEEGLVMNNVSGNKKLLSLDILDSDPKVIDAKVDSVVRTCDKYIMGSDDKLYEIIYNNGIVFNIRDKSEFIIENKKQYNVIRQNEVIAVITVDNKVMTIKPVSTFTHNIRSNDTKRYIVEIVDDDKDKITMNQMLSDNKYFNTVGGADIHIQDINGVHYIGNMNAQGILEFTIENNDNMINHDISSNINSEEGWYKFSLDSEDLYVDKIFNNIYLPLLSYDNDRDFTIASEDDVNFDISADSKGDIDINPSANLPCLGAFLRSDNEHVYCIGVENNKLVTYVSYFEKNNVVHRQIFLRDIHNSNIVKLYMSNNTLVKELVSYAGTDIMNEIAIYDKFNNKYSIYYSNGNLTLLNNTTSQTVVLETIN